ncbi:non-ribosomal peptide synthetase [Bacillus pseudomycoides]|nr:MULTISPECIES: non-ribosomal peptide synthetase [Bacillus]PGB87551.1 non-ribosomal peptide synthetase [Bacillus pseudomycoides]PGS04521.1 non-ribosomal peptide synthetase [Bacillus pseudomycoides]PHE58092.1 non-ribosomal peptide synthetase [Bacillus pseudomycoides]
MNSELSIEKIHNLSPLQKGMLYHDNLDENSLAYRELFSFKIKGNLSVSILEEAFRKCIERHSVLRSFIAVKGLEEPKQVVLNKREVDIHHYDFSGNNESEKLQKKEEVIVTEKNNRFDLSRDILIRLRTIKLSDTSYEIILVFHHIILDGWSFGLIVDEIFKNYKSIKTGQPIMLDAPIPFEKYINWINKQDHEETLGCWKEYLDYYDGKTDLLLPDSPKDSLTYNQKEYSCSVPEWKFNKLKEKANSNSVTLNSVIKTLWGILLQKYNNSDDVVFGSVISGRSVEIDNIHNIVGMIANTIPIRVKKDSNTKLSDLIKAVHHDSRRGEENGYISLADIQTSTSLKNRPIDHIIMFNYNFTEDSLENISDLEFKIQDLKTLEQTNYDFNLLINAGKTLEFTIKYNSNKYDVVKIKRIASHFNHIIEQVITKDDMLVKAIEVINEDEKNNLLKNYLENKKVPERDTIIDLFQNEVSKSPNKIAVDDSASQITYSELERKSNTIAHFLISRGVTSGSIVSISCKRSVELVIGIVGILKSGAAFLPIDPDHPSDRIDFILKDSQTKVLLTDENYNMGDDFGGDAYNIISILMDEQKEDSLNKIYTASDLAYVIYTSGSTGNPKGVMIQHYALLSFCKGFTEKIDFVRGETILAATTVSFDIFIVESILPLLKGLSIILATERQQNDPIQLAELLSSKNVCIAQFTPSKLQYLLENNQNKHFLKNIKHLIVGGEPFPEQLLSKLEKLTKSRIYNVYGPTEGTIWTMIKELTSDEPVTLGTNIGNSQSIIVDKYEQLLPVGAVGELCLTGDLLAKGYLGNEDLTKEKFIHNPFLKGTKMYKTGDLARRLPNGEIEFCGRADHQMKIRGVRIEPYEIESALLKVGNMKHALVTSKDFKNGSKYLCAYYTSNEKVDEEKVKKELLRKLPIYLVPSIFYRIDQFPVSVNGKIDREQLPEPIIRNEHIKSLPQNETEEIISGMLLEILDIQSEQEIGREENFFELGGHSLKAMNFLTKVNHEFKADIKLTDFFENPTIRGTSDLIIKKNELPNEKIQHAPINKEHVVSSAQKRIMVMYAQIEHDTLSFNLPMGIRIKGKLDIEHLRNVLKQVIQRHEALRTSFGWRDSQAVQKIHKEVSFELEHYKMNFGNVYDIYKDFVKPFNLEKAPLFRAGLFKVNQEDFIVMMDMHHIISDETSMSIIVEEIIQLYEGHTLPKLEIHYKDYCHWQTNNLYSEDTRESEEFWLSQFKGKIEKLNLPLDYKRPSSRHFLGEIIEVSISNKLSEDIRRFIKNHRVTLYIFAMAVYSITLSKIADQEEITVGSPVSGRSHHTILRLVGNFTNTIAIRNFPKKNKEFTEYLYETKNTILKALDHQSYQFDDLVRKLNIERENNRNPLFDTMLAVKNVDYPEIKVNGLAISPIPLKTDYSRFDLTLNINEKEEGINVELEFDTEILKHSTAKFIVESFVDILKQIIQSPHRSIREIEIADTDTITEIKNNFKQKEMDMNVTFDF